MNSILKDLLTISDPIFTECLHGLERESLRANLKGDLSLAPHPKRLGSALTHPYITTDFSEAQIEYTTSPHTSLDALMEELTFLCYYTGQNIDNEYLWPFSMPCILPPADQIPLAVYGNSPIGLQKHIYRSGLAHRYGAKMQTISGVHYNFSFSQKFWEAYFSFTKQSLKKENTSEAYLSIIRNFLRRIYIFPYLFGNSPAMHKSFFDENKIKNMDENSNGKIQKVKKDITHWDATSNTLYSSYATSLRQSEIGYNHPSQWDLAVSYNSLEEYVESICNALTKIEPRYQKWSLEAGEQLNHSILQIENEHYSPIRPKQNLLKNEERSLVALKDRGVQYIELRCFDIQNQSLCGVLKQDLCFAQLLLYHCLLSPSPPLHSREEAVIQNNYHKVIWGGRRKDCSVQVENDLIPLREQGLQICDELEIIAQRLDDEMESLDKNGKKMNEYQKSLSAQREKFLYQEATPSAQFFSSLSSYNKKSAYIEFGLAEAKKNQKKALSYILNQKRKECMDQIVAQSVKAQKDMEKNITSNSALDQIPSLCF